MYFQLESQNVRLVEWFSLICQLIQHRNPTLREGIYTPLAIQAECKDNQEMICLPKCLDFVYPVGCHLELCWLPCPMIQDVSYVRAAIGSVEQSIHPNHQQWKMIHLLIIFHPKGRKLCSTGTAQYHCLRNQCVRQSSGSHMCMATRETCKQPCTILTYGCSHRPISPPDSPQSCLRK